jgi:hypothetical protein
MRAQIFRGAAERKFIPILRSGEKETAIPIWLGEAKWVDLRGDDIETALMGLVSQLHGRRDGPPPLGPRHV